MTCLLAFSYALHTDHAWTDRTKAHGFLITDTGTGVKREERERVVTKFWHSIEREQVSAIGLQG